MNNSSSNSDVVEYTATAPGKIELVGMHFVMQVITVLESALLHISIFFNQEV